MQNDQHQRGQRRPILMALMMIVSLSGPSVLEACHLSTADIEWSKFGKFTEQVVDGINYNEARERWGSSAAFWRWHERAARRYRDAGLRFWDQFPGDTRRFDWLVGTVWIPPYYWSNLDEGATAFAAGRAHTAEVDAAALQTWERKYWVLKSELIADKEAGEYAAYLECYETIGQLLDFRLQVLQGDSSDLNKCGSRILDVARTAPEVCLYLVKEAASHFIGTIDLQYNRDTEASFLSALGIARHELVQFSDGRLRVAELRRTPFAFAGRDLGGAQVSTSEYRGRVVLIDIWSNGCAGCIEELPKLASLREEFDDAGFDILGIWYGGDTHIVRARELLASSGAGWKNIQISGEMAREFDKQFGIIGVPVKWLIGRDGRVLAVDPSIARMREILPQLLHQK